MRSVILCEGKTDAILLSYYLGRVYGWNPLKGQPKNCRIETDCADQNVDWYVHNNDNLLICAVGGNTNFGTFYHEKIERPLIDSDAFQKLVIITDHDNNTIRKIETNINKAVWDEKQYFKSGMWTTATYKNSFEQSKEIQTLLKIIPEQYDGALETVMLNAISEDAYDKRIVDRCKDFIDQIRPYADKYISKDRLALKAKLSATWAVQSPEKAFDFIDQQIRMVPWENSEILRECFSELSDLTN